MSVCLYLCLSACLYDCRSDFSDLKFSSLFLRLGALMTRRQRSPSIDVARLQVCQSASGSASLYNALIPSAHSYKYAHIIRYIHVHYVHLCMYICVGMRECVWVVNGRLRTCLFLCVVLHKNKEGTLGLGNRHRCCIWHFAQHGVMWMQSWWL